MVLKKENEKLFSKSRSLSLVTLSWGDLTNSDIIFVTSPSSDKKTLSFFNERNASYRYLSTG